METDLDSGFYLRDWLVQPDQVCLSGPDGEVRLAPRVMAVLCCLAERPGEVVTRETFGEEIWAPAIVTDDALTHCIAELRRVLGDKRGGPRFIETVPKRGYRLVAPVRSMHPSLDPPPERSGRAPRHNLPTQRSSFIGREAELERLQQLIEAHRLVTLTGVGGSGKTRLALEVGAREVERFTEGVFFVDLSSLSDDNLIPRTVAAAMELPLAGVHVDAAKTAVLGFLAERSILLVLDNCEHLIDGCAAFVDEVLSSCPSIVVLATSREALAVEGEQVFRVPSLRLPDSGSATGDAEAVRLFVARAEAADPEFVLTPPNETHLAEICRRLDGMPLALELAAARVTHLSLPDMLARLDDRFRLLTGGHRRRTQRQQTLQAAVDWSYELLAEDEKTLLARLSVFAGGFTLEAVEGICMEGLGGTVAAPGLLGALVAKSLVVVDEREATTRYRLLETIRLYAADRLVESGEATTQRDRHRDWFLAWIETHPLDELTHRFDLTDNLGGEMDNFRAALDWSETEGAFEAAARLAVSLIGVWRFLGHQEEAYRRLQPLTTQRGLSSSLRARCIAVLINVEMESGDFGLIEKQAEESLELDPYGELAPLALWGRAICRLIVRRIKEARTFAEASFQSAIDRGQNHQARCMIGLQAQLDVIETQHRQAITRAAPMLAKKPAPSFDDLFLRIAAARAMLFSGNPEGAHRHGVLMKECVKNPGSSDKHFIYGRLLTAEAAAELGECDEARRDLIEAVRALLDRPHPLIDGDCAMGFAALNAAQCDYERTARLLKCIVSSYEHPFRAPVSFAVYCHYRDRAREALDDKTLQRALDAGRSLTVAQALREELERAETALKG